MFQECSIIKSLNSSIIILLTKKFISHNVNVCSSENICDNSDNFRKMDWQTGYSDWPNWYCHDDICEIQLVATSDLFNPIERNLNSDCWSRLRRLVDLVANHAQRIYYTANYRGISSLLQVKLVYFIIRSCHWLRAYSPFPSRGRLNFTYAKVNKCAFYRCQRQYRFFRRWEMKRVQIASSMPT